GAGGDDRLEGGAGDILTGGTGRDTFVAAAGDPLTITDFRPGEDILALSGGLLPLDLSIL
ncbi:MAG: hypothetical protein ACFB22_02260, partial [Rhodothalassiaceae bacterium]